MGFLEDATESAVFSPTQCKIVLGTSRTQMTSFDWGCELLRVSEDYVLESFRVDTIYKGMASREYVTKRVQSTLLCGCYLFHKKHNTKFCQDFGHEYFANDFLTRR